MNKPYKFPRKDGIKYIKCEHLTKKIYDSEVFNVVIGESTRLVLCSVCTAHITGRIAMIAAGLKPKDILAHDDEDGGEGLQKKISNIPKIFDVIRHYYGFIINPKWQE